MKRFFCVTAVLVGIVCAPKPAGAQAVFKVGTFNKCTTAAPCNQTVPHGLGTTPVAIIFWTANWIGGSDVTACLSCLWMFGFSDGTNSRAISSASAPNQTTQKAFRRMANVAVTMSNTVGTLVYEGNLSSPTPWDATNFYFTWSNQASTNAYLIHFLAIGGTGVQAKALTINSPTATNSNLYHTGVGFQPDLVLFTHALGIGGFTTAPPISVAGEGFGLGVMDNAGNQWATTIVGNNGVTDDSQRGQQTNMAIYNFNGSLTDTFKASACVPATCATGPMDVDGFRLNWQLVPATASYFFALALHNVNFKVGSFSKTTQTTGLPFTQSVSGFNFQPSAVLLATDVNVASATAVNTIAFSIGASDGTHQGASALQDINAANPTLAYMVDRQTSRALALPNVTVSPYNTTVAEANLTTGSGSLDATGFTLSWQTQTDATAMQLLYLALGPLNATSVTLASFTATRLPDGKVRLDWRTGYEVDNVGFRVYREQDGKRVRINSSMVPGTAVIGGGRGKGGQTYTWSDGNIPTDQGPVQYWLEDVDLHGKTTWHGPYVPVPATAREPQPR